MAADDTHATPGIHANPFNELGFVNKSTPIAVNARREAIIGITAVL
jgi:hypothetical protein